ncbi:MAG TPA: hypothetical protein VFT75_18530 [Nocardioidaceae bacterium]|nr:hypothetical protein [Nocardioidaceae bacterium]
MNTEQQPTNRVNTPAEPQEATVITNLTTHETLRAEARAWIERNGLPVWQAVDAAIKCSDAFGDPHSQNPFRHALLEVAAEIRAAEAAK